MRPYAYRHRATLMPRLFAAAAALLLLCPPCGGLLTAARAQGAATDTTSDIKSILLFPFANGAGDPAGDTVAARLTDAVKLRINSLGRFTVTGYSRFLPSVQRAANDGALTKDDLTPPFDDPQKAAKIATEVATDAYLTGSVEAYKQDATTQKVTLTVSANLYSTATRASLRGLAFSSAAAPLSASETSDQVMQRAVNDVAGKIVSALNAGVPRPHQTVMESHHGRDNSGGVLLAMIGIGLIVGIASNHHHDNNSSSGGGGTITTTPPGGGGGPPGPPGF